MTFGRSGLGDLGRHWSVECGLIGIKWSGSKLLLFKLTFPKLTTSIHNQVRLQAGNNIYFNLSYVSKIPNLNKTLLYLFDCIKSINSLKQVSNHIVTTEIFWTKSILVTIKYYLTYLNIYQIIVMQHFEVWIQSN